MKISFTKMQGAGNDFIMLNAMSQELPQDLAEFSRVICHRQFGVGADQVLIVKPAQQGDFSMDIYNADGGRVEMCGNGIRCFHKFLIDENLTQKAEPVIETLAGLIYPRLIKDHPLTTEQTSWITVDMGAPILQAKQIPVNDEGVVLKKKWRPEKFKELEKNHLPFEFDIHCVSMGNPHCVIFVDDVASYPVTQVGSVIENDPYFPKRVNVEFVEIKNKSEVIQRTWERGSGETLACGTGACASAVATILARDGTQNQRIHLKGGILDITWQGEGHSVYKTGPATTVFKGQMAYKE